MLFSIFKSCLRFLYVARHKRDLEIDKACEGYSGTNINNGSLGEKSYVLSHQIQGDNNKRLIQNLLGPPAYGINQSIKYQSYMVLVIMSICRQKKQVTPQCAAFVDGKRLQEWVDPASAAI